jgi:hypothetical protein
VFAVERRGAAVSEPAFATFHMFDTRDEARVPLDIIRGVCENLDLPPDIFSIQH